MPIYHGYARLFAGVFHRESKTSSKDAFIGRVAVELARLKPGCTYDVTLPLRLSTGVYSRRKLGAVRLRLTLSKFDAKDILLSYLPHRRNRTATTVACGDPKSFRNVALTVHGKHLPGKFSTEALMATVRELTLVQKSVLSLAKKSVQDLIAWRHPVMSSFAFVGWMHCVRAGSATLAPAYLIGFALLNLVRNYARCVVGQKDFQPTRMEEMLAALKGSLMDGGRGIEVKKGTHMGQGGLYLFQTLGLLKADEYYVDGVDTYTHKEFPFSTLAGYPRFHVEEATKPATTENLELDDGENICMFHFDTFTLFLIQTLQTQKKARTRNLTRVAMLVTQPQKKNQKDISVKAIKRLMSQDCIFARPYQSKTLTRRIRKRTRLLLKSSRKVGRVQIWLLICHLFKWRSALLTISLPSYLKPQSTKRHTTLHCIYLLITILTSLPTQQHHHGEDVSKKAIRMGRNMT